MEQKCGLLRVLEIFFIEPTTIHFIKEISRKINLAPTSVRNHIKTLLKENQIKRKKAKPFNGYIANRENDDFIFNKRIYNLYSLKGLTKHLISAYYPQLMAVFGSYGLGEDTEKSDIDLFILSKTKKELNLDRFEKKLKRKINPIILDSLDKLDKNLRKKIWNGIVLYGGF
jgi:predicted nucleotidyltransferase